MDKPPDNQVFSLPEEFIYKLFDESNEQLTVAKGLLKHYVQAGVNALPLGPDN